LTVKLYNQPDPQVPNIRNLTVYHNVKHIDLAQDNTLYIETGCSGTQVMLTNYTDILFCTGRELNSDTVEEIGFALENNEGWVNAANLWLLKTRW